MPDEQPGTRAEVLRALEMVEAEVASFFGTLPGDLFNARVGEAWTPAEHLKHLNTSVNAVARGVAVPKLFLWLRFGRPPRPGRDYAAIGEIGQAWLQKGVQAPPEFVPEPERPAAGELEHRRREILARWGRVNARLRTALEGWSDAALDRWALPHPRLGRLSVREMLFFTLHHNRHHIAVARRRLGDERSMMTDGP
jgi:hypothetical protein